MLPWWLILRAPMVLALLLACVLRRLVDHLLVWPVLLALHHTGIKPRPRIVRTCAPRSWHCAPSQLKRGPS
jgi:hypothetical protein